jgi:hypothetical protein
MKTIQLCEGLRAAASTCPAAVGLPRAIKTNHALLAARHGEVTNPRAGFRNIEL